MEKITIAIPVYNVEKYVERALNSALNQTYPNIEILAIDDKGSDGSMDVVRRVQREHPKGGLIRIVEHKQNRGTGAARNTGIDEAFGAYLMYLDSDDEITIDCVDLHYKAAKEVDAEITVGNHKIKNNDLTESIFRDSLCENNILITKDKVMEFCFPSNHYFTVYPWNKLYKISFLKDNNIRCIESHTYEDILLTFQVTMNASRVRIIDNITYVYYLSDNSTMSKLRSGETCTRSLVQLYEIIDYKNKYRLKHTGSFYDVKIQESMLRFYIFIIRNTKSFLSPEDNIIVNNTYNILKPILKETKTSLSLRFDTYVITNYPMFIYTTAIFIKRVANKIYKVLSRK